MQCNRSRTEQNRKKTVSNCLPVTMNRLPIEWALIYVVRHFEGKIFDSAFMTFMNFISVRHIGLGPIWAFGILEFFLLNIHP